MIFWILAGYILGIIALLFSLYVLFAVAMSIFEEAGLEQEEDKINRLGIVFHQVLTDNDFSFLRKETHHETWRYNGNCKNQLRRTG